MQAIYYNSVDVWVKAFAKFLVHQGPQITV